MSVIDNCDYSKDFMRNNKDWTEIRGSFQNELSNGSSSIRQFAENFDVELNELGFLSLVNVAAMHAFKTGKMFDVASLIDEFPKSNEASILATASRARKVIAESYCPKTDLELSSINSHTDLKEEVYRDSTGVVYSAKSNQHDQPLEAKLVFPWSGRTPQPLFTLKSNAHQGISSLADYGTIEGFDFLVRIRPEGKSLASLSKYPAAIEIVETVDIMVDILDAVDHCHCMGLVFRRIRPEHIQLESGQPVISIFEFAPGKIAWSGDESSESNFGHDFVSPVAQDVFNLGVLLNRMLTGINPFRFDSDGKYFRFPREYRKEIDKDLENICLNSISRSASNQFKSARQFKESLENWRQRNA